MFYRSQEYAGWFKFIGQRHWAFSDKLTIVACCRATYPMHQQRSVLPEHAHWSFLLDQKNRLNAFRTRRLGANCGMARKTRPAVVFVRTDECYVRLI